MNYKFFDTCSLLLMAGNLFEEDNDFELVLSSITLDELENIKTASNKDADIKYAARKLLHTLLDNPDKYQTIIFTEDMLDVIKDKHLTITPDVKILASALHFKEEHPEVTFVSNDLALQCIAELFFDSEYLEMVDEGSTDDYDGYAEITMSDEEMTYFYQNPTENMYDLYTNEYLIIKNSAGEVVDKVCWTGTEYRALTYHNFKSTMFGDVRAKSGDVYQALMADSLVNNTITMVKGPAGSGKTYLSLAYLMHMLDRGKIDKIIIFCNTVATKNSAKLGYYPGTRDEKLLDSQIGNLLTSKLGGRLMVEHMIEREKLVLLPLSDIRGYDTSGMNAGIYISEAQNMDISLMKLVLQRIGDDAICIIDGDCKAQVDAIDFAGANNGMRKASKVFRGEEIYGEVTLKNIHRSRIAQIAERM